MFHRGEVAAVLLPSPAVPRLGQSKSLSGRTNQKLEHKLLFLFVLALGFSWFYDEGFS